MMIGAPRTIHVNNKTIARLHRCTLLKNIVYMSKGWNDKAYNWFRNALRRVEDDGIPIILSWKN